MMANARDGLLRRVPTFAIVIIPLALLLFYNGNQLLPSNHVAKTLRVHHENNTIGICSLVNNTSSSQLWMSHVDDIVSATTQSLHVDLDKWIRSLFTTLSPEMLQQSIRSRPSSASIDPLIVKIQERIRGLDTNRPIQIVVVGGSVTRGVGSCLNIPSELEILQNELHTSTCAWPSQLESLINTLTGMNMVKVHNLAVGATNLEFGMALWKYHLYPETIPPDGPDIIISAYATNEQASHITDTTRKEWIDEERRRVQDFIKVCRDSFRCEAPLVLFVDDSLGNRQGFLRREMSYNKVVTELADWYGNVMHVSYADAVRRHVYADTNESVFTAPWPLDKNTDAPKVNVHVGLGGHVSMAWVILYSMMDFIAANCVNQEFAHRMRNSGSGLFRDEVLDLVDKVPPPDLTDELSLTTVSQEWREILSQEKYRLSKCQERNTVQKKPCEFAFLAGPELTVKSPDELQEYLKPYVVQNKGWKPVMKNGIDGNVRKLGLAATQANARIKFRLTNIQQNVDVLNVQYIKSYGKKGEGSQAKFTLRVDNIDELTHTDKFELEDYHNDTTRYEYFRMSCIACFAINHHSPQIFIQHILFV